MLNLKEIEKKWYLLLVSTLLVLGFITRFYQLGQVPHGMTWDEAAIGYNGYAVLTTRRDEWLNRLPVSFQSFGDYKAPFAIYLNGFSTLIFGMNLFAVRLPFAVGGLLTILGIIYLIEFIFRDHKYGRYYAVFAGFLTVLSPWHFHYSRTGFESGLALMFLVWGIYFFLKALNDSFSNKLQVTLSFLLFVLSTYTYHSSKVTLPIFLLIFAFIFRNKILVNLKKFIHPGLFALIISVPLIKDTFFGEGLTRASVTIFSQEMSFFETLKTILANFITHLSPSFLIFGETTTLRHGFGSWGVLFATTLFLVISGLVSLIGKKKKDKHLLLFSGLILAGIFPAAIAGEVPHSNRAFLSFLGFVVVAVYGLDFLIKKVVELEINKKAKGSHGEKNIVLKSVVGTLLMLHLILFYSFINFYFSDFKEQSADAFKDGYVEAFEIAKKYEYGDGVEKVDRIIFTSDYGQPYIYGLFVRKTNPIWYRGGSLNTYQFSDNVGIADLSRGNVLVVGSNESDLPTERADHIVRGSDGSVRFQIFRTN